MTRIETEEQSLLSLSRLGMAPSAADRARVRAALTTTLATPAPTPTSEPAAPNGAAGTTLGAARIWTTRLLVGALMAGIGATGYWAGYRKGWNAGNAQSRTPAARSPLISNSSANTAPSAIPVPVTDASALPMVAAARSSKAQRRSAPLAPEAAAELPIDEELRTLRRAEHALRQGNPRLALVLLEDLQRSTQGGRLQEERAAEMVIARCTLQPGEAAQLRREFEQTHPRSVYSQRVMQTCKAK